MKHALIALALLLSSNVAYAAVTCSIATGNPQEMVFGTLLYEGNITSPVTLVVAKDGRSEQPLDIYKVKTEAKWKALDGNRLITISQQPNDVLGITLGRVDLTKSRTNMLPLDAMVFGVVGDGRDVMLIAPQQNLSINCRIQK